MPSDLKRLTVYLPDDIYFDLLKYCKSGRRYRKLSMSAVARDFIIEYVEKLRKQGRV